MPTPLLSQSQIPNALYYVTMTDRFLSGWGPAEGKRAKYVACCDSWEQAKTVQDNAEARGDQKHINVRTSKPRVTDENLWQLMTQEDSAPWYIAGNFKKESR